VTGAKEIMKFEVRNLLYTQLWGMFDRQ